MIDSFVATQPTPKLANFRVLKIVGTEFALAGASDANACGFMTAAHSFDGSGNPVIETTAGAFQPRGSSNHSGLVWLEAAAGASFTAGAIAYQAANGQVSHTGTVRVGLMIQIIRASSPTIWSILAD